MLSLNHWQTPSSEQRARGREGSEQERHIILAQLRREIISFLHRGARIREAHRQTAKKRAWAKREEEREQDGMHVQHCQPALTLL